VRHGLSLSVACAIMPADSGCSAVCAHVPGTGKFFQKD
jgi:hypothetical protein